jgi:hypothetical protein
MVTGQGAVFLGSAGDAAVLLAFVAIGALLVKPPFRSRLACAAAALLTGLFAVLAAGGVLLSVAVVSRTNLSTLWAMPAAGLFGGVVALWDRPRRWLRVRNAAGLTAFSLLPVYLVAWLVHVSDTILHFSDTSAFLMGGRAMAAGRIDLLVAEPRSFYSFPPGAKLSHAFGYIYGAAGVHALGVVLLLTIAVLVGQATRDLSGLRRHTWADVVVPCLAVAALLSSERMWFFAHSNGSHMAVAAAAIALASTLLHQSRNQDQALPDGYGMWLLAHLSVVAVVLHRLEAVFIVAVLLTPALARGHAEGFRMRTLALWKTLGVATVLWAGTTFLPYHYMPSATGQWAGDPRVSIAALMFSGFLVYLVAPVMRLLPGPMVDRIPWLAAVGLWAGCAVYALLRPVGFWRSVNATARNLLPFGGVAHGGWRLTGVAFAGALLVALIVRVRDRSPQAGLYLFPVLTYLPAALVAALLRSGDYRIGVADSLNRSWSHVLPLAVVALAAVAWPEPSWLKRRRSGADGDKAEQLSQPDPALGS